MKKESRRKLSRVAGGGVVGVSEDQHESRQTPQKVAVVGDIDGNPNRRTDGNGNDEFQHILADVPLRLVLA